MTEQYDIHVQHYRALLWLTGRIREDARLDSFDPAKMARALMIARRYES